MVMAQQKGHRRVHQIWWTLKSHSHIAIYPGEACKELDITASALECVARAEYNACSLRYKCSLPVSNAVILELQRFAITKLEKEYPKSNALIRSAGMRSNVRWL